MPEDRDDFICVFFMPKSMHNFVEILIDDVDMLAKEPSSNGIDLANFEVPINEVHAQRSLIQKRFELKRLLCKRVFCAFTFRDVSPIEVGIMLVDDGSDCNEIVTRSKAHFRLLSFLRFESVFDCFTEIGWNWMAAS